MTRTLYEEQVGFAGGMNLTGQDIRPDEIVGVLNGRINLAGEIERRPGTQRIHTSALADTTPSNLIRVGYSWHRASGVRDQIVIVGDKSKVFTANWNGSLPVTWNDEGEIGIGLFDNFPDIVGFRDGTAERAYIGMQGLHKFDGSTLTTSIAGAAAVNRLAVYNYRLFGATGTTNRLYWSALGNGDSLGNTGSGGGFSDVVNFGKGPITGLQPLGSSLLIFHRRGISRFTGWSIDDINISTGTQGVSADTGTISHHSIVANEQAAFFIAENGVFMATEEGVRQIDNKIPGLFQKLAAGSVIEDNLKGTISRKTGEIIWTLRGTTDDRSFIFNYKLGQWYGPWDGVWEGTTGTGNKIMTTWDAIDNTGNPVILLGASDGFVRVFEYTEFDTYKDDVLSDETGGSEYIMSVVMHRKYFGAPNRTKGFRTAYVHGQNHSGETMTVDLEAKSGNYTQAVVCPADNTDPVRVQLSGFGEHAQLTISETSDKKTTIAKVGVKAYLQGERY